MKISETCETWHGKLDVLDAEIDSMNSCSAAQCERYCALAKAALANYRDCEARRLHYLQLAHQTIQQAIALYVPMQHRDQARPMMAALQNVAWILADMCLAEIIEGYEENGPRFECIERIEAGEQLAKSLVAIAELVAIMIRPLSVCSMCCAISTSAS